jgi:hypothetical protein
MTWQLELTERLRYYINDLDSSAYKWTDNQLQKFIIIAASHVLTELPRLDVGYDIHIYNLVFIPDPTSNHADDFCNLIVLKAACILARAELKKTAASGGFKIVDDKSTVDTTGTLSNAKAVSAEYCDAYEGAVKEFERGNQFSGGAVFGPHTES